MYFFVGSTNPIKIQAVEEAACGKWPTAQVVGFAVSSQVSHQPMTDEETQTGAINRAKAALSAGLEKHPEAQKAECLGIGLEGGVTTWHDQLWSTVWVAVIDLEGKIFTSNGARIKLPDQVAQPILQGGEMGPVVGKLIHDNEVSKKQGMFGVVTKNLVTRQEEYTTIAKMAIGLWYGRDWDAQLK